MKFVIRLYRVVYDLCYKRIIGGSRCYFTPSEHYFAIVKYFFLASDRLSMVECK